MGDGGYVRNKGEKKLVGNSKKITQENMGNMDYRSKNMKIFVFLLELLLSLLQNIKAVSSIAKKEGKLKTKEWRSKYGEFTQEIFHFGFTFLLTSPPPPPPGGGPHERKKKKNRKKKRGKKLKRVFWLGAHCS